MNVLFLTQSLSLDVFYEIARVFRERDSLDHAGFYVSDPVYFSTFCSRVPEIDSGWCAVLKEWEIIRDSADRRPDRGRIAAYEKHLGGDSLWSPVVADRRIYGGPRATLRQDYRPRYSHERILSILELGLERMEALFDKLRPDLIVSFVCVTLGEYLAYLFATSRGITFLNLRPTRIQNYLYAGESVLEPSECLRRAYQKALTSGPERCWTEKASAHLEKVRHTHARYEGVVTASARPPRRTAAGGMSLRRLVPRVLTILKNDGRLVWGKDRSNGGGPGILESLWWTTVSRPLRAWHVDRSLRGQYVREDDLPAQDYAFFPLHTEPEVTLNVYSRPYLNQIEAARLVSHNLPVGMKLVVKEHPWSVGRRPLGYYRKLLQIPNVLLASPGMESRPLLRHATLVTVISSSIGLEAMILHKPVVTLGRAPFTILPRSMIRHVHDPDRLGYEIRDLLESHRHDETALICYIATVMKHSVPVDWYSRLLGRQEAYREANDVQCMSESEERQRQIESVAAYLLQCARETRLVNAL